MLTYYLNLLFIAPCWCGGQGRWGGGLPWTWALLCGGSALVLWCLTRIPPVAAANSIPPRPPPHPQGASKSLDSLCTQTNYPQPWKCHLPMFPACPMRGSRGGGVGAFQGPRSSLPLHPLGTGAALEPTHRHSCSDWASFPVQFHSPVLLSVCLSVWITGRPVDLFLGNITAGPRPCSSALHCYP